MKYSETITHELNILDLITLIDKDFTCGKEKQKKLQYMGLFSKILKKYKYDILKTHSGFQIITNGYGSFKHLKFTDFVIIPKEEVYTSMLLLDLNSKIQIESDPVLL